MGLLSYCRAMRTFRSTSNRVLPPSSDCVASVVSVALSCDGDVCDGDVCNSSAMDAVVLFVK
jgi:hypothetical protein